MNTRVCNSISGLRAIMIVGVAAASIVGAHVVYTLVSDYYAPGKIDSVSSVQRDLEIRSKAMFSSLLQSRQTVSNIAANPRVVDLVEFGSVEQIEQWVLLSKHFVPDSLGIVMIRSDGSVIGNPDTLHIGEACMTDIHDVLSNRQLPWPMIHRDQPGNGHFDILVPVYGHDGDTAGYLFARYRLSLLDDMARNYTYPGEQLKLLDNNGDEMASSGEPAPGATTFTQRIGDSQLHIELNKPARNEAALRNDLLLAEGLLLVLVISLPLLISRRIWKLARKDFESVRDTLDSISSDPSKQVETAAAQLVETGAVLERINELSRKLAVRHNELERASRHDPLTGLPNRRYLEEYLLRTCNLVDRGIGIRIAIIDIDMFKQVNDNWGHHAGDAILKQFAYSIKGVLRAADFACRYAGDEFCVIFVELETGRETLQALKRLAEEFERVQRRDPVTDGEIFSVSIGTIRIEPSSRPVPEEIIRKADEAMYHAKQNGRGRIVDYHDLELRSGNNNTPLQLVDGK